MARAFARPSTAKALGAHPPTPHRVVPVAPVRPPRGSTAGTASPTVAVAVAPVTGITDASNQRLSEPADARRRPPSPAPPCARGAHEGSGARRPPPARRRAPRAGSRRRVRSRRLLRRAARSLSRLTRGPASAVPDGRQEPGPRVRAVARVREQSRVEPDGIVRNRAPSAEDERVETLARLDGRAPGKEQLRQPEPCLRRQRALPRLLEQRPQRRLCACPIAARDGRLGRAPQIFCVVGLAAVRDRGRHRVPCLLSRCRRHALLRGGGRDRGLCRERRRGGRDPRRSPGCFRLAERRRRLLERAVSVRNHRRSRGCEQTERDDENARRARAVASLPVTHAIEDATLPLAREALVVPRPGATPRVACLRARASIRAHSSQIATCSASDASSRSPELDLERGCKDRSWLASSRILRLARGVVSQASREDGLLCQKRLELLARPA